MKSVFEKDFFKWENLKKTWEMRSIVFFCRVSLGMIVLVYLITATPKAWNWGQMQYVRMDDISKIDAVLEHTIKTNDPEWTQKWLTYRPKHDAETILEKTPAFTSGLSSMIFFELARRAKYLDRYDDYVFWTFYARYRLRYDLMRCGSRDSADIVDFFMELMGGKDPLQEMATDKEKIPAILQKVLDYDAMNPARNNPAQLCAGVNLMQGGNHAMFHEKDWARIRHMLRNDTEKAIRDMNAASGIKSAE